MFNVYNERNHAGCAIDANSGRVHCPRRISLQEDVDQQRSNFIDQVLARLGLLKMIREPERKAA